MHNEATQTGVGHSGGPQFREAYDRLVQIVLDGLRHGHFRCSISSGIGKGNRRELVIEAGKSHKYTIHRGRARAQQIPLDRRISRSPAGHTSHLDRMELFAAFYLRLIDKYGEIFSAGGPGRTGGDIRWDAIRAMFQHKCPLT
jgi:hypothetical protein